MHFDDVAYPRKEILMNLTAKESARVTELVNKANKTPAEDKELADLRKKSSQ
jgi:hypothetical protein